MTRNRGFYSAWKHAFKRARERRAGLARAAVL